MLAENSHSLCLFTPVSSLAMPKSIQVGATPLFPYLYSQLGISIDITVELN
jgi:hypothetical protein